MKQKINIFWFRRDLRLVDNTALFYALSSGLNVLPVFIFDTEILSKLPSKTDARVHFIHSEIGKIKFELEKRGSSLKVFHSKPIDAFKKLTENFEIAFVYANKDYEPYAINRDTDILKFLQSKNIGFKTYKDQVVFEENEVVKNDGNPYTVFTPFSKKWKEKFSDSGNFPSEMNLQNFIKTSPCSFPSLSDVGFSKSSIEIPSQHISAEIIKMYAKNRDLPAIHGTSRLGVHLRFGTVSIRQLVKMAAALSETFLNELIWREFFMQILWHFPQVVNRSFKSKYDQIEWRNNEAEFEKWCEGRTGFPIVDAGIRELNATGFMHNRVRMVVASFLCKHLLIDWRWGEAYFAEKLLDFELAANNGNWQWAAGSGCDAVPYFRVFNPETQLTKFDPQLKYVQKWVPEYGTIFYARPIVEHKFARERALSTYKKALN